MSKYVVVVDGIPSPQNEDWLQKSYYLIEKLIYKKHQVELIIINRFSNYKQKKILKFSSKSINLKKKIKILFLKEKKKTFKEKFISLFSLNSLEHFNINQDMIVKVKHFLGNDSSKKVICFGPSTTLLISKISYKFQKLITFNGSLPQEVYKSQILNLIKTKIKFSFIFSILLILIRFLKETFFIKKIFRQSSFIICFDEIVYQYLKKKKINAFCFTNAVKNWLPKKISTISKIKRNSDILFIGGISTPNINATLNFKKFIIPFIKINLKKLIFHQIRIVGAKSNLTKEIESKKYSWINVTGWIDDISKEFCKNKLMIIPNDNVMYTRTRIYQAFSCGLPVLTHIANTKYDKKLIHNKNILIAKNFKEFNQLFLLALSGKVNLTKISKNSRDLFEKYYDINKIIDKIYKLINE